RENKGNELVMPAAPPRAVLAEEVNSPTTLLLKLQSKMEADGAFSMARAPPATVPAPLSSCTRLPAKTDCDTSSESVDATKRPPRHGTARLPPRSSISLPSTRHCSTTTLLSPEATATPWTVAKPASAVALLLTN